MSSSTQTVYVTHFFHSLNKHSHRFAPIDLAETCFFSFLFLPLLLPWPNRFDLLRTSVMPRPGRRATGQNRSRLSKDDSTSSEVYEYIRVCDNCMSQGQRRGEGALPLTLAAYHLLHKQSRETAALLGAIH